MANSTGSNKAYKTVFMSVELSTIGSKFTID